MCIHNFTGNQERILHPPGCGLICTFIFLGGQDWEDNDPWLAAYVLYPLGSETTRPGFAVVFWIVAIDAIKITLASD